MLFILSKDAIHWTELKCKGMTKDGDISDIIVVGQASENLGLCLDLRAGVVVEITSTMMITRKETPD